VVPKANRSKEFDHYCKKLTCPNGHHHQIRFIEGVGDVVTDLRLRDRFRLNHPFPRMEHGHDSSPMLRGLRAKNDRIFGGISIERFRVDSEIECGICAERWPVFQGRASKFEIVDMHTIRTFTTPLVTETSRLDNSGGSVAARMSTDFEQAWTERIEVDWERATTTGTTTSTSLQGPIGAKDILVRRVDHRFEETLKNRIALTSEKQQKSGKTIEVTVPAGRVVLVTLEWKQVWSEVECKVRIDGDESRILLVPARHAFTVSVDQTTRELP